jgi:hypothetical protein
MLNRPIYLVVYSCRIFEKDTKTATSAIFCIIICIKQSNMYTHLISVFKVYAVLTKINNNFTFIAYWTLSLRIYQYSKYVNNSGDNFNRCTNKQKS